ncbi:MAG TPA: DUF4402 domain-containing protein [Saprospiraceae bacterium]|nr:DUF4402 domain-containing protein [Saprospiraceae bacterium]HPI05204.1 DUF4402 domain-containing protein [Saprospiraceae bacterium]
MNHSVNFLQVILPALLAALSFTVHAQTGPTDTLPGDPGALSVHNIQDLHFGVFSQGEGGTVTISAAGVRSVSGDVIDYNLGISYFQALFEVAAPAGAIISVLNGPDATLTGSNGGSMSLELGGTSPEAPFLNTTPSPGYTNFGIGGTLTVGNPAASPPGVYSGTFYITFNLE